MKHYIKLDGLRFIAIFLVLVQHFATYIGSPISAGYYGVDLFFVLSGFLITNILLQDNKNSFSKNYINFLGRRTLRIFPIYYLTLLILWILNLETVREYFIFLITYTWNYKLAASNLSLSPVIHFWSLSVEEQFYLFWPLIVLLLKKSLNLLFTCTLLIVAIGYSQIILNIIPSMAVYNNFGLLTRMSSLGMGALGIILYKKDLLSHELFKNKYVEIFMLLLLGAALLMKLPIRFFFMGICSLYFVLKACYYNYNIKIINQILLKPKVLYLGKISYGIYLFHIPLEYYLNKFIFNPIWESVNFNALGVFSKIEYHSWIIKFPIYSLITIAVASISYKYLEEPIISFKDKWFNTSKEKAVISIR